eukprot:jgi/Bigna1/71984/fgenesh1_pg.18_\
MGITIAIENDAKFPVTAEIRLKGGIVIAGPKRIEVGETWKKTDGGISASMRYDLVIYDESNMVGDQKIRWKKQTAAPALPGEKLVQVSRIMKNGKQSSVHCTKGMHKIDYLNSLWSSLTQGDGDITEYMVHEWAKNEEFVNNKVFKLMDIEGVKEMLGISVQKKNDEVWIECVELDSKRHLWFNPDTMRVSFQSPVTISQVKAAATTADPTDGEDTHDSTVRESKHEHNGLNHQPSSQQHHHQLRRQNTKKVDKERFVSLFKTSGLHKTDILELGFTVLKFPSAQLKAAALVFHAMDAKRENVVSLEDIQSLLLKSSLSKISEDPPDFKDILTAREKGVTFWEWMNCLAPINRLQDTKNRIERISTIRRLKEMISSVKNLTPSDLTRLSIPQLTIVIEICGSRGDVQPFIPIAQKLSRDGHRVRIATHANFRKFVMDHGLEFYPLGGDPKELMKDMVETKGQMMPTVTQFFSSKFWKDTSRRMATMEEIIMSGWEGANAEDKEGKSGPFKADAVISNPTTYSHIHLAEAMGVPLHMFFTMPWTPTEVVSEVVKDFRQAKTSDAWKNTNIFSYYKVDKFAQVGMSKIFQKFRKAHGLPLSWKEGSNVVNEREVPFTYVWSSSLIPKPADWGRHISIAGFCELEGSGFKGEPPTDIASWIKRDDAKRGPPLFVGFGSCVLVNPKRVSKVVAEAARIAGIRVVMQQGWAGLGSNLYDTWGVQFASGTKLEDGTEIQKMKEIKDSNVLVIGRVSHSWLFTKVAGVCHHGGAGTTYAGLVEGRPTLISPFFGDQPFWGKMVADRGAGPEPKNADLWEPKSLAETFKSMFSSSQRQAAETIAMAMRKENGVKKSVELFYQQLNPGNLMCDLLPRDCAKYYVKGWKLKLGKRALKVMVTAPPMWFSKEAEAVYEYRPCEWTKGKAPTIGRDVTAAVLSEVGKKDFSLEKSEETNTPASSEGGSAETLSTATNKAASAVNTTTIVHRNLHAILKARGVIRSRRLTLIQNSSTNSIGLTALEKEGSSTKDKQQSLYPSDGDIGVVGTECVHPDPRLRI